MGVGKYGSGHKADQLPHCLKSKQRTRIPNAEVLACQKLPQSKLTTAVSNIQISNQQIYDWYLFYMIPSSAKRSRLLQC